MDIIFVINISIKDTESCPLYDIGIWNKSYFSLYNYNKDANIYYNI